ncbi:MAG: helix-turn-helix domain-containing protein, partial [Planctomycetota bacterium]
MAQNDASTGANMPEILTLKDVARYLRINERTVAKLAHEGKIPSFKVASQWRFSKEAIDGWFAAQMQQFPGAGEIELPKPELSGLLSPEAVTLELSSRSKAEVLVEMAGLLAEGGFITDVQRLLEALSARERLCSTGIGRGLAFLHPRRVLNEGVS